MAIPPLGRPAPSAPQIFRIRGRVLEATTPRVGRVRAVQYDSAMRVLALLLSGLFVSSCSCGSAVERPEDAGTDALVADAGGGAGLDATIALDVGADAGNDAATEDAARQDAAVACSGAVDCDDGDPCNGTETCASGFCAAGTDALAEGTVCRTGGKGATCLAGRCVPNP
jgi:hypothetical protein